MGIKNRLERIAAAGVGVVALTAPAVIWVSPAHAAGIPAVCTFRTTNGNFLTAVDGGGHGTDGVRTTATTAGAFEQFTLVPAGDNIHFGFRTSNGHFLTAVGGGGRNTDAIHADATTLSTWEEFRSFSHPDTIQTIDGHFLTAVGGGGRTTDALHTDATAVGSWEVFQISCTH
ncbi:hypothetical protein [Actinomadura sp. DC4]|uniref:fascin domain-containing protein n=1 Tax=Actinomadura sp. DC4 TaxID=3055069 RepID=UPI0025AFEA5E|nr:hypothetical protein [Actinomadura sp. DC4]MDN3357874.1 hypothetical protein [Actinomadura sp. DC4]